MLTYAACPHGECVDGTPNNAEAECLKMGLPLAEVTGDEAIALQASKCFHLVLL